MFSQMTTFVHIVAYYFFIIIKGISSNAVVYKMMIELHVHGESALTVF